MPSYGYTLFSELNPGSALVDQAVAAEEAGFDFVAISDHFHPWLSSHPTRRSRGACWVRSPHAHPVSASRRW